MEIKFYRVVESRSDAMKLERKIKNYKSQQRVLDFIDKEITEGRGSRKIENQ